MSNLPVQRADLVKIEPNPVRVGPDGVLAIDALANPSSELANETSGRRVA